MSSKENVVVTEEYAGSYLQNVLDEMAAGNPLTLSVFVSVVVVVITLLWFILRGSSKRRSTVLLLGPCDAGKSLLFLQLVHKRFAMTYTSLKENKGHFIARIKDKILTIVDIPGHDRLRSQYLDEYASLTLAVIFVVDSATISKKTVADVAEFLYAVLTDPVVYKNRPRVLIACNKQDRELAKRKTAVKSMLETELNTLRKTRSAALASTGDDSDSKIFLGREDRDFEFSHLGANRVEFAECSCRLNSGEEADLAQVVQWLEVVA